MFTSLKRETIAEMIYGFSSSSLSLSTGSNSTSIAFAFFAPALLSLLNSGDPSDDTVGDEDDDEFDVVVEGELLDVDVGSEVEEDHAVDV